MKILDACCGSKMFYFDKTNPNVTFMDIRRYSDILCDGRKKVSNKFEQYNLSDLVFEVLEIVIFDEKSDGKKYSSKDDKLAHREMFYITHNQTADEGLNKMIETSKIETQLSLKLEEC